MRRLGASDLLLVAGVPPSARVDGRMTPLDGEATLDGDDVVQAVLGALPPHAVRAFTGGAAVDARLRTGVGRFRVNLHRERGRAAAAIRVLPSAAAAAGRTEPAARRRGAVTHPARPGARRRRHRRGQDHDAGRARRRDQPARRASTSSPSKIRSSTSTAHQRVDRRAGRDRHRRARLPDGAAGRGAPGARRHRRRRDARPRDDADRAGRRRDRPRRLLERAHDRRGVDRRRGSPTPSRRSGSPPSARIWRWRWPRSTCRRCCRAAAAGWSRPASC